MSIGKGSSIETTAEMSEPTSMVPVVSIVTETIKGRRSPNFKNADSTPCKAAFICKTS